MLLPLTLRLFFFSGSRSRSPKGRDGGRRYEQRDEMNGDNAAGFHNRRQRYNEGNVLRFYLLNMFLYVRLISRITTHNYLSSPTKYSLRNS